MMCLYTTQTCLSFLMKPEQITDTPLDSMDTAYVKGKQHVDQRLLDRGNRMSRLALMSVKGLLDVKIIN